MNEEIMLSVIVPTYNHEKYIAKALDSILMQKTNFPFEVLVGEDASTDGTKKILEEYEKAHPGFFTMIYRTVNTYKSGGVRNSYDLCMRAKGKYIITLEGDDYWINPQKLQIQVDFLERHPEYIAVAHNTIVIDENNEILADTTYPECKDEEYTFRHYASGILPGQTATVMSRNFYKSKDIDFSVLDKGLMPGDRLKVFVLCTTGKIYCIQEAYSMYRFVRKGGSSFSANNKYNFEKLYEWNKELMFYAQRRKNIDKLHVLVTEAMFLELLISGLKRKEINIKEFICRVKLIKNKLGCCNVFLKMLFKKHILKQKFWI